MASATDLKNLSNILTSVEENLQLVVDQLQDGESSREPDPNFTLQAFWQRFELVTKLVSKEATTLCMAFTDEELPDQQTCTKLMELLERAVLALVSAFYSLPKKCGLMLRKQVQVAAVSIVAAIQELVKVIRKDGNQGVQNQRTKTGSVWESCDDVVKLPRDNCGAVLNVAQSTSGLIRDALQELEEAVKDKSEGTLGELDGIPGDGSESCNEDTWSEADRLLLPPSMGLVKAARSCVKKCSTVIKTNGKCDTEAEIVQLDDLGDLMRDLSPVVDEFVCSLYGPMNQAKVKEQALLLSNSMKQLLTTCKHSHVTTENDASWIEFLEKAIHHNIDKINELAQQTPT